MERVKSGRKNRVNLLSVPLDLLSDNQLEDRIAAMLADGIQHQIALLSLWDFIKARGNSEYSKAICNSSIILTSSKLVVFGARFLRKREITRYMPFNFVIRLLSILETKNRSVYLIGAKPGFLQTASSNLRGSFPGLQIVGRCAGYFPSSHEENILMAIKKASPSLLLAGKGLPGRDRWLIAHKKYFAAGLTMWCGDCLDVFAGKKKKTSKSLWEKGLDFLPDLARKPWRIARAPAYAWYFILLLYNRIRKL